MKFIKNLFSDKQKKFFLTALSAFLLTYLFLNKSNNFPSIYKLIKSNTYSIFGRIKNLNNSCKIPFIKELPDNSIVFIGHAYGSPLKLNKEKINNGFLAPKVGKFLESNHTKINTVIFTGDLFMFPSPTKWIKLKDLYSQRFNILIAPGNLMILGEAKINIHEKFFPNFLKI